MLGATTINIPFSIAVILGLKSNTTFIVVVIVFNPHLVGKVLIFYSWYPCSAVSGYMNKVVTLVTFYL